MRSLNTPATPRRLIVVPAWNEETVIGGCLEETQLEPQTSIPLAKGDELTGDVGVDDVDA